MSQIKQSCYNDSINNPKSNKMINTATITESHNYFGDSVYEFLGESYNFYQYNCSNGRELIEKIRQYDGVVFISTIIELRDETVVIFKHALDVLQEMLHINDSVCDMDVDWADCAGTEVASMYGY